MIYTISKNDWSRVHCWAEALGIAKSLWMIESWDLLDDINRAWDFLIDSWMYIEQIVTM